MDPIADFIAITECGSEDIAIHYLAASDFNLDDAMSLYASDRAAQGRPTNFATNAIPVGPAQNNSNSLSHDVQDNAGAQLHGHSSSPTTHTAATAPGEVTTRAVSPGSMLSSSSAFPLSASPSPHSLLESGSVGMARGIAPLAPSMGARGDSSSHRGTSGEATHSRPPHTVNKLTQEVEEEDEQDMHSGPRMGRWMTSSDLFGVAGARSGGAVGPTSARMASPPVLSNPFAGSDNPALARMFRVPSYVHVLDQPLAVVCEKASRVDQWILIALCDGFFASVALTSSLWNVEAMQALGGSLACYAVDVRTDDGRQLAQGFCADSRDLPRLFLVDPITSHCEQEIATRRNAQQSSDGAAIVNDILQFMAEYGSPHQYLESRQSLSDTAATAMTAETSPNRAASLAPERAPQQQKECVGMEDGKEEPKNKRSAHDVQRGSDDVEREGVVDVDDEDEEETEDVIVPEVNIDAWRVGNTESSHNNDVYRMRCRLPRQLLELALKPETPVGVLVRYLAYRVHIDSSAIYRTPPPVVLQSGFPPKQVALPSEEVSLRDCTCFRSGDVIIVRPQAS